MSKARTLEVIIRGDLVQRNLILKLGEALSESKFKADFSASIVVPPFQKAVAKHYPSLGVLYVMVDLEDKFNFERMLSELCKAESCEIVSIRELEEE
ncbi:MAG: hypothetical protein QXM22_05645 [Candidatus Bathyarchaeia archaeon]